MLIRTQDKTGIIDMSNKIINTRYIVNEYGGYYRIEADGFILGHYLSKEKAIRVLDMILEEYQVPTYINDRGGGEYARYDGRVFHMPEDDEV